jgi:SH3-like domain-containing protein
MANRSTIGMGQPVQARSRTHRCARIAAIACRLIALGGIVSACHAVAAGGTASSARAESATGASGLPVPRFVSLKADRVNLRAGPSTDYPTSWIFRRAGLPVEVIREAEGWRQVRDAEGTTGWVLQTMLSGRRTALVLPWDAKPGDAKPGDATAGEIKAAAATVPEVELRQSDNDRAPAIAKIEAGVIASVRSCDKRWCHITVGDFKGYVEQKKLWGVYDGEIVK